MPRSNFPQALSVVSVTQPDSVDLTVHEIIKFDDKDIGFSHDRTWQSLPYALTGKFDADAVSRQFGSRTHPRVAASISALCALGSEQPRETSRFRDFAEAGLKEVQGLRLDPAVTIVAKATCWYVEDGVIRIPILQPRLAALSATKLGMYVALARKGYCRGVWQSAEIEVIDLSERDSDGTVTARTFTADTLPIPTDDQLHDFLGVYLDAKRQAEEIRAARGPRKKREGRPNPGDTLDLFPGG